MRWRVGPSTHPIRSSIALVAGLVSALVLAGIPSMSAGAGPTRTSTVLPLRGYSGMAVDGEHRHVFVAGSPAVDSSIVVMDYGGAVVGTVEGEDGASSLYVDRKTGRLYVTLDGENALSIVDTSTLLEVQRVPLGATDCPRTVTMAATRVWFGFGCGQNDAGIGSYDPDSGRVRLFTGARYPDYAGMVASGARSSSELLASNAGIGPATLILYQIGRLGGLHDVARRWNPGPGGTDDPEQMSVARDGTRFLVASGAPYYVQEFGLPDITFERKYPTGPYPISAEYSPDGAYVAAGLHASYDPDVYVFPWGSQTPVAIYELGNPSGSVTMPDAALAWDPRARRLFAVSVDDYGRTMRFHVLPGPSA